MCCYCSSFRIRPQQAPGTRRPRTQRSAALARHWGPSPLSLLSRRPASAPRCRANQKENVMSISVLSMSRDSSRRERDLAPARGGGERRQQPTIWRCAARSGADHGAPFRHGHASSPSAGHARCADPLPGSAALPRLRAHASRRPERAAGWSSCALLTAIPARPAPPWETAGSIEPPPAIELLTRIRRQYRFLPVSPQMTGVVPAMIVKESAERTISDVG
jgi:hypothetical protein